MKRILPFALAIITYTIASIAHAQITTIDTYNVTCDSLGGAHVHVANEILSNTVDYGSSTILYASSPGDFIITPTPSATNAVSYYVAAFNPNPTDNDMLYIFYDGVGNIVYQNWIHLPAGQYVYQTFYFDNHISEIAGATFFAVNGSFELINFFITSSNYTFSYVPTLSNNDQLRNLPANTYAVTATNLTQGIVYQGSFTILEDFADVDNDGANCTIDCNDNDPLVSPLNAEQCDGFDNDCNGLVDDGLANVNLYGDNDQDGYGFGPIVSAGCVGMNPYLATNDLDCDDSNAQVNPGIVEIMNNTIDDDCNANTPDYIGVDEWFEISFSLYPNPAAQSTSIQFTSILSNENLRMYNLVGSLVKTQAVYSTRVQIDLTDLPAGIYLVKYGSHTERLTVE